eukprot:371005_1
MSIAKQLAERASRLRQQQTNSHNQSVTSSNNIHQYTDDTTNDFEYAMQLQQSFNIENNTNANTDTQIPDNNTKIQIIIDTDYEIALQLQSEFEDITLEQKESNNSNNKKRNLSPINNEINLPHAKKRKLLKKRYKLATFSDPSLCKLNERLHETNVNGFYIIKHVMDKTEAADLAKLIESTQTNGVYSNNVLYFNRSYVLYFNKRFYGNGKILMDKLEFLSVKLSAFCERLINDNVKKIKFKRETVQKFEKHKGTNQFSSVLINKYKQNGTLFLHEDDPKFGEFVVGITIKGRANLTFQTRRECRAVEKIYIPNLSLYFMTGEARYNWLHGFEKGDVKSRRISLTYRYE